MKYYLIIILFFLSFTPSCSAYKRSQEATGRKALAEFSQNQAIREGLKITFSVSGEDNTILTIKDPTYTEEAAKKVMADEENMKPYRDSGFKKIIFTNGQDQWKIDVR